LGSALAFGTGSTGTFSLNGTDATLSGLTTAVSAGSPVISNGAAGSSGLTVSIATGMNTFGGSIVNGGTGSLAFFKDGAGTLRLTGANTNSGNIVIAGTLEVGQGGSISDVGISSGAILSFNRPDSFTYSGVTSNGGFNNAGSVTVLGGGNMTLTGSFSHDGGTSIAAGQTLTLGTGGSIAGAGNINVSGNLAVDAVGSVTIGAPISGPGNLVVTAGTLVLTNANTYLGATTIGATGILQVGNGGTVGALPSSAVITDNGEFVLSRSGNLTFANSINGSGAFTSRMATGGNLTLTGVNAYSGATNIASGTLTIGAASAWANSTSVVLGSVGNSATLELNGFSKTFTNLATAGTAANQTIINSAVGTSTLTFSGAGTVSFGGSFVEAAGNTRIGIAYTGGGILSFANTNTYTGGTVIANGTARLGADNAFSTGALTLGGNASVGILDLNGFSQTVSSFATGVGATPSAQIIGNTSTSADAVFNYAGVSTLFGSTIQDAIATVGTRKTSLTLSGVGTVTLTGVNTYSGATNIGATANLQIGNYATTGAAGTGAIVNSGSLIFARSDAYALSAANVISGPGAIVLASSGTVSSAAPNTLNSSGILYYGSANGATVVSGLDLTNGAGTVGGLLVRTKGAVANTLAIGAGQTLLVRGNVTIGYASGAVTDTRLAVTGGGTLSIGGVGNSSKYNVQIGGNTSTFDGFSNKAYLDLSGLAVFYANLATGTFRVGDASTSNGGAGTGGGGSTILFAPISTVIANDISTNSPIGVDQTIRLGSTSNTWWTDTVNFGGDRAGLGISFLTSSGSFTLRNRLGTGRSTLNIANVTSTTGYAPIINFDLLGHPTDMLVSTLTIGTRTGTTGGLTTASLSVDTGIVDANTVLIGSRASNDNNVTTGTLNIGGTLVFNVGVAGMTIGNSTVTSVAPSGTAVASVNVTGTPTLTILGPITLGASSNANGLVTASLLLNGGSLDVRGNIAKGAGAGSGSVTSTLTLDNATLNLNGFVIGAAARPINTFNLRSGTLRNVGEINGGLGFTKTAGVVSANNTLILEGINSFSGNFTISAGTVQVGTGSTTGTLGTTSVINNAALILNRSNAYAVANMISGAGTLAVTGAGAITLSGNNSYAGTTTITAGLVSLAHSNALGGTGAGTSVTSGASLELQGGITVGAEALAISGPGNASNGALRNYFGANVFGGTVTLGGATTIQSDTGTLTLDNPTAIVADVNDVTFTGAGNATVSGAITGSTAGLTKTGNGKLTLGGNSTFQGAVNVNAGTVSVNGANGLGDATGSTTVASGASLELLGNVTVASEALSLTGTGFGSAGALRNLSGNNTFGGNITLAGDTSVQSDAGTLVLGGAIDAGSSLLTVSGSGNITVNGAIAGLSASLIKNGTGTLTLANILNSYQGATVINAGVLALGAIGVIDDFALVNVNGGSLNLGTFDESVGSVRLVSGTIAGSTGTLSALSDFDVRSGTISGKLAGSSGLIKTTAGTVVLSGVNTFTGPVSVNAGVLSFASGPNLGDSLNQVTVNGGTLRYTGASAAAASQDFIVGSAGGTIEAANKTGTLTLNSGLTGTTGILTKTGTGTVTVNTTADLGTGGVVVSQGVLNAGFAANGIGSINIASGATLNLFDSSAVTASGVALTMANGATLGFDLNAPGVNDKLVLTGTPSLNGIISLNLNNLGGLAVGSYDLITDASGSLAGATWILGNAPTTLNYQITTASAGTILRIQASQITYAFFNGDQGSSLLANAAGNTNWATDIGGGTDTGVLPALTDALVFGTSNVTAGAQNLTLDGDLSVDSLIFNALTGVPSIAIAQGTSGILTLTPGSSANGIAVNDSAGAITISAPLVAAGAQTWKVVGTGSNGSSLALTGPVSFTGPITKIGTGTLTLSGANTGAGGLNFTEGTLNLGSASAVGSGVFQLGSGITLNNVAGSAVTLASANAMVWKQGFTVSGNNLSFGNGAVTLTDNATINAASLSLTGAGLNSNTTVTLPVNGTSVLSMGMPVSGTSIPASTKILSVSNTTTFLMTSAATATATNQTLTAYPTFTVDGIISDAGAGLTLTKTGEGFLALGGINTFGGAGKTVDIQGGLLSVNSNAALGDPANTVTISANGTENTGFRATESFSSARTFNLNAVSNAFTVTNGKTLTLSSPFTFGAVTNTLFKNEAGMLVLSADNSGWTGGLTVNSGIVRLNSATAAGTGALSVSPGSTNMGTALQLSGGFTWSNPITLQASGAQTQGGVNFGGQLQSLSGANYLTGLITMPYGAVIGSNAGSTLNIMGGINAGVNSTIGNTALRFTGDGNFVLSTTELTAASGTTYSSIEKYGTGTFWIRSSNSTNITDTAGNGLVVKQGSLVIDANGTWRSKLFIENGATVTVDDSVVNFDKGRFSNYAGSTYFDLTMRGGNLNLLGATFSSFPSYENFNTLVLSSRGANVITLTQQNTAFAQTILAFRSTTAWTNPTQAQTTAANGVGYLFRGIGEVPASARASVQLVVDPSFSGENGGNNTVNRAILPWALVDLDKAGQGTSFATTGVTNNGTLVRYLRPLISSEYETNPSTILGTANGITATNLQLTGGAMFTVAGNATRNSLTMEGGSNLSIADGAQFNLRSGGILVRAGSTSTISGGVLFFPNNFSPLTIWTVGDLTINSALSGGNGVSNGNMSLIKNGLGTLTIAPVASTINGLAATGTNTLSGQFVLNQGTLKLGAGINNAIQPYNFFSGMGGTLDLNGTSLQTYGFFNDSQVPGNGTNVTSTNGMGHLMITTDTRTFSGTISGPVKFSKSGNGTFNFYSDFSYSGATLINGGLTVMYQDARFSATSAIDLNFGNLYLENNNSWTDNADRIPDTTPITMRGGYLELRGRAQNNSSERIGTTTLALGQSQFFVANGAGADATTTLTIGNLVRNVGTAVNFTSGLTNRVKIENLNGVPFSAANLTNGIIGGWAVMGAIGTGTHHFATYSPIYGVGAMGTDGFLGYSNTTTDTTTLDTATATSNLNISSATTLTIPLTADKTINSLRFDNVASSSINFSAGTTLTVGTGGVIMWSTNQQVIGTSASVGNLTSGTNELIVEAQGNAWHVIRANIVGAGMAFVKTGSGTIQLEGINTYDGGTFVNQGTLVISPWGGGGRIPLATDVTKGLVVTQGIIHAQVQNAINPLNEVIVNAGGVIRYFGDNTVQKLTMNNSGSATQSIVRSFNDPIANLGVYTGDRGILTIGAGGLVATSQNILPVSYLEGRFDFGTTANTIDVAPISVNGVADVDALRPTVAIQAIVGSSGGITKTGNGVLQFNAQYYSTGAFTVAAGGIKTGVTNAGSRLSRLTLGAGSRFDLNGLNTTWGSLAGSGDIFSSTGTPTLSVGFDNTSSTFSGRLMRFNDAAYGLLTKVGTGVMTFDTAQPATGSFGAITVSGGGLTYSGNGKAFVTSPAANSIFNVQSGTVLALDNTTTNINNRLGAALGGTVNILGGKLTINGNSLGNTTESFATLGLATGNGRLELSPDAGNQLSLVVTNLAAQGTGSLVIAGLDGTVPAGPGVADLQLDVLKSNMVALQGFGGTSLAVRGDILVSASRTGLGDGFLTFDTANFAWRALASADLNTTVSGWNDIQNAGVTGAVTLSAPTSVNTLTFDGATTSLTSGLSASTFGKFGPAGTVLNLTLAKASAVLVKSGTAQIDVGLVGSSTQAPNFHVLAGATLNVDSYLGMGSTVGFIKSDGGVMNLNAITGLNGVVTVNGGTLRLNSGFDNTIPVIATTASPTLMFLTLNGGATLDIGAKNQTVNGLTSVNPQPGMGGTITGLAGSVFTTTNNSTFSGVLTGGLSFQRAGNTTTILTAQSTYTGTTTVRGGILQLRDEGAIANSSAVTINNGELRWDNFGFNAAANPTRISATTPITINGGMLNISGGGGVDTDITLGTVTANSGNIQFFTQPFINEGSSNKIVVTNFVRTLESRSMVNFNGWTATNNSTGINTLGSPGLTSASRVFLQNINGTPFTAANLVNGIIGGWAVADASTFATYTDAYGLMQMGIGYYGFNAPGFTGTDISAATVASGNYNDGTVTRTLTGTKLANSWRFAPGAAQTIAFNGANVTLGTGIITNANQTITLQASDNTSSLTTTSPDLYIYQNQGTMNINVQLTGTFNLIRNGGGTIGLGSPTASAVSNTFNGTSYFNQGTTNLNGQSGLVILPGDVVINGVNSGTNTALVMVGNPGQIAPTSSITINGGGTLTMTGTNTLSSVIFNNEGGQAAPNIATSTLLVLSSVNPVTSVNQSQVTTPVISGALQFSNTSPVITVNSGLADTGLLISAVISNGGNLSLTKVGGGMLALSGASTFTTGLNLNEGTLMFGANSTPITGTVTSGPIGTGLLSIGNATSLMSDGTIRTIANGVSVNGDFSFGGRTAGAGVILSGLINLGGFNRTISVATPGVTATFNGLLTTSAGSGSTGLTKAGNGILVLGSANTNANFGGAGIVVAAGLIRNGITDAVPSESLLTMSAGAGFDLNGFDQTLNGVGGAGFITNSSLALNSVLTLGDANDATFGGSIVDNSVASAGMANLRLTKVGSGKLTLTGLNGNVGQTNVTAGILELAGNGVFGSGNVDIATGASVNVARSLDLLFTNVLQNAGDFRQTGTGMTSLMADNAMFAGRFYVDAGILQVGNGTVAGNAGNVGSATKIVTTAPGVIRFNLTTNFTNLTRVEGTGDYIQQSGAVLTLGTNNPLFTGRAIAAHGTMEASATGALAAAGRVIAEDGATFKLTGSDALGTSSYGVPLTLNGTGIANATTYTGYLGNVTLNGGNLTSDASPNGAGSWILLGNVSVTADSTISAENINVGLTSATRDFNVAAGKVLTFLGSYADAAPVTGASSLSKSGDGTLVLGGSTKTYTGTNLLTGGFLKFADAAQLGASSATVHANLVFAGGSVEFTGGGFGRNFLVKDGGAGFHATSGANPFVVDGASQIDFDDTAPATATSRPLTLSGTSTLENTYDGSLFQGGDAAQAFSSIVKNGVGQWIVAGTGTTLAPDADVNVNGGVLGFYLNSLGTTGSAGNVNLANGSTLRWESNNSQDLGARLKVADGATATIKFDNASTATTFNGGMNFGTGALVKSGAGDLILAAANTFSGGLTVAQGKVTVGDAGALGTGTATIGNAGTMVINQSVTNNINVSGNGSIGGTLVASVATGNVSVGDVTVGDRGTLSRGASIGSFTSTRMTLSGGARLEFKIWDINTKAAGVGYDQFVFGDLDLSGASVSNKVVIKLISLTDGTNLGAAGNLSLLQGAAGIQNFSFGSFNTTGLNLGANTNVNDLFAFDTSQFTYTGGTASAASLWAIDFNTANGAITLTAVPEPSTYGIGLGALALAAAAIRRRRRQEKKA
jgi:autotransporter-associated beta strand protein